jgi:hypothetical protein
MLGFLRREGFGVVATNNLVQDGTVTTRFDDFVSTAGHLTAEGRGSVRFVRWASDGSK